MLSVQESYHRRSPDWDRTVYIDTLGVSTLDFEIGEEKKQKLIEEGRKRVEKYFEEIERKNNSG